MRALVLATSAWTVAFLIVGVTLAVAYPTPSGLEGERYAQYCPPRSGEYSGTDEAAKRATEAQQATSDDCVRREQQYAASAGATTALHGDLWAITGAIVGAFVGAEALRKLWP